MSFTMLPKPPFDFQKSAQMHSRFQNSLPDLYENNVYMRVLRTNKNPLLVSVSSRGTIEHPRLSVHTYPLLNNDSEIFAVKHVLRSMFEPTFDFDQFYAIARKDLAMRNISKKLRGLRPIRPQLSLNLLSSRLPNSRSRFTPQSQFVHDLYRDMAT